MSDLDLHAIQELAKLAREETFRPGWPYGGSGEWTDNVIGMLGGATGNFAGAMSPDVVDALIARIRDLEAQLATPPAITGSVSFDGHKPTFVNLTLANGARVVGEINDGLTKNMTWSNPTLAEPNTTGES